MAPFRNGMTTHRSSTKNGRTGLVIPEKTACMALHSLSIEKLIGVLCRTKVRENPRVVYAERSGCYVGGEPNRSDCGVWLDMGMERYLVGPMIFSI